MLTWHPSSANDASPSGSLANKSAKFRFKGISAHAAAAPERGRSALDGVESMNVMVNMMREHVPEKTRIHYVITRGGSAPNVIPDFAEVYYYVRHPEPTMVKSLFDRVVRAAEGAALGTGTGVSYEVIHGIYNKLPNDTLARRMDAKPAPHRGRALRHGGARVRQSASQEPPRRRAAARERGRDSRFRVSAGLRLDGCGGRQLDDADDEPRHRDVGPRHDGPLLAGHRRRGTSIGVKGMLVAAKTLGAHGPRPAEQPRAASKGAR